MMAVGYGLVFILSVSHTVGAYRTSVRQANELKEALILEQK